MCKGVHDGDTAYMILWADRNGYRKWGIDKCLKPLLQYLNRRGVLTLASCCNHNNGLDVYILVDREATAHCIKLGAREIIAQKGHDTVSAVFRLKDMEELINEKDRKWGEYTLSKQLLKEEVGGRNDG